MARTDAKRAVRRRFEELCREIGVLLLVFAPIDAVLAPDSGAARRWLLTFALLGGLLLGIGLTAEYRRVDAD